MHIKINGLSFVGTYPEASLNNYLGQREKFSCCCRLREKFTNNFLFYSIKIWICRYREWCLRAWKRSPKYETNGNNCVWWNFSKTKMLGIEYVQYWKGDSRKQRKCHGIRIDVSDQNWLFFFMPAIDKISLINFLSSMQCTLQK